jgi:hypothetical protein
MSEFDPDEMVQFDGKSQSLLRVVHDIMKQPPERWAGVNVFREGQPSVLGASEIEDIANCQPLKSRPHEICLWTYRRRAACAGSQPGLGLIRPAMTRRGPARRRPTGLSRPITPTTSAYSIICGATPRRPRIPPETSWRRPMRRAGRSAITCSQRCTRLSQPGSGTGSISATGNLSQTKCRSC